MFFSIQTTEVTVRPFGTGFAADTSGVPAESDRLLSDGCAVLRQKVAQPVRRAFPVLAFPAQALALGIAPPPGHSGLSGGLSAPQPPLGFPSSRWSSTAGYLRLRRRGNALALPAERDPPARDLGSPAANLRTGGKRAVGEGGRGAPRSQGGREGGTWADRLPNGLLGEDCDGTGLVVWRRRSERPRTHRK